MKTILLLVHRDGGQASRLQAAIDVTRHVSGHIMCLDIVIPPDWGDDSVTQWGLDTLLQAATAEEVSNRAEIEARFGSEGISWGLVVVKGDPGRRILQTVGFADLIVVTSAAPQDIFRHARRIAAEITIEANRPVLAVPPRCRGFDPRGKVLVAWDGEAEANDAMRAAIPLLQQAAGVTLLEVNDPRGPLPVGDAVGYLAQYGINGGSLARTTGGPVADAILERAEEEGARFVVMGAFSRGRAAEAIFGGVTRRVLQKSDLPLFLFH